jgi:hypothetical protein
MFRSHYKYFVSGLTASLAVLAISTSCMAQSPQDYSNTPPGPFHQPVAPFPVEFGFSQDHSSTAAEGFLRGKAAVIQAHGNFELSKSQAEILRQQARWLDRENDLKQTAALIAQKKMWAEARLEARHERHNQRAAGLQFAAEKEATVYRQAYQLAPNDLDVITGTISWPATLQAAEFEAQRAGLDELFQHHFSYGDPQAETAAKIARSVDQLSRTLGRKIGSVPREQYVATQKFLRGLKYTAASYAGSGGNAGPVVAKPIAGATLATQ